MSNSAQLYINPTKWNHRDVIDLVHLSVVEKFGPTEFPTFRYDPTSYGSVVFLDYNLQKGTGMVFINFKSEIGGIPAILIDASSRREKSKWWLYHLAEKVGGLYRNSEGQDFVEKEDPFQSEEDFTLKMVQIGGSHVPQMHDHHKQMLAELVDGLVKRQNPEVNHGEDE